MDEESLKDQSTKTTSEAFGEFHDAVRALIAAIDSQFKISDRLIWMVKNMTNFINFLNERFGHN